VVRAGRVFRHLLSLFSWGKGGRLKVCTVAATVLRWQHCYHLLQMHDDPLADRLSDYFAKIGRKGGLTRGAE
jgi:hypothetical protein